MSEQLIVPSEMEQEYFAIERFAEKYGKLTYLQLDSYTTQKVNLFALPEHERFYAMEFLLDKIIAALPALKRIFSKPITRLKDVTDILPTEAVRVINNTTMEHISRHTELWGNVTREGLKPKKLMTLSHVEEYQIYENVAFARLIDGILSFVRQNMRLLKDIMYSCQPMRFNLLERTNHLNYFVAIGKLHVGYAHAQDSYHHIHQRCLEKLFFIDKTLRAKLKAPVYQICRKDTSKLTLKKTNVFRLQKDYRQVYNLLKLFENKDDLLSRKRTSSLLPERGYADYCTLLSVFAVGHFNFDFPENEKLCFADLNTTASYKGWELHMERHSLGGVDGLMFEMCKEKSYSVCLLFYRNEIVASEALEAFQKQYPADEYLFAEPAVYGKKGSIYLSLFDIDSFRRIQQFILRAMVYADEKRTVCPFCGSPMEKTASGDECALCKTLISRQSCPETEKPYFVTEMKGYRIPRSPRGEGRSTAFFEDKEVESALFFRNITPLSSEKRLLCPHCRKIHK